MTRPDESPYESPLPGGERERFADIDKSVEEHATRSTEDARRLGDWLGTLARTGIRISTERSGAARKETPSDSPTRRETTCRSCGTELTSEAHFCHACGAAVETNRAAAAAREASPARGRSPTARGKALRRLAWLVVGALAAFGIVALLRELLGGG